MRCSNIQVSFKIPVPINKPDGNGAVYTKEAVENSVNNLKCVIPIVIRKGIDETVIGFANKLEFIEENEEYYIQGVGHIRHGGTEEKVNIQNNTVTSMEIVSVGIADE